MRTVQQLREQNETQAETIKRLNIDNLRLTRENAILQHIIDQMRKTDDAVAASQAWEEAERYFTQ